MGAWLLVALAFLPSLPRGVPASLPQDDDVSLVRAAYVAAFSEADTAKLAAVYSPSALVASGPRFLNGPAEIVEELRAMHARGVRAQLQLHPVSVSVDGGLAQEAGTCRTRQSVPEEDAHGAYVIVYTRATGEWLIALEIRCVATADRR